MVRLPPHARAPVVDDPDPDAPGLDDALLRQPRLQGRLVHVAVHAGDGRPDPLQSLEELGRDEVAGVQHELGAAEQPHALVGQRTRATRKMRVGDNGDAAQEAAATSPGSCRKRPAFQISSPSA